MNFATIRRWACRAALVAPGLAIAWLLWSVALAQEPAAAQPEPFRGRVNRALDTTPRPVRNDVAQAGEEIVTLRYFRIRKGTFEPFLKASQEGVWPYFEKLGARVIGMWQVISPPDVPGAPAVNAEYDEVYLSTRYASIDHWKASREAARHGGNGPDWEKCQAALDARNRLTILTTVTFLKGSMASNGPYFMPGLDETFEKKDD